MAEDIFGVKFDYGEFEQYGDEEEMEEDYEEDLEVGLIFWINGSFKNHVDMILLFFDHPPSSLDISYLLNVDKDGKF